MKASTSIDSAYMIRPACSSCSEKLICQSQDGNFELKEEYEGRIMYAESIDVDAFMEEVDLGYILN